MTTGAGVVPGPGRAPIVREKQYRGGGKPGRVCLKRPAELRDMLRVRDQPDRADLTPAQQGVRQLLRDDPGAFAARLTALEEAHRAAVRDAEARRRSGRKSGTAAAPPPEEELCDGPPGELVARLPARVVALFIPARGLVECLTIGTMRVEGLDYFEVAGCLQDPARKGVVLLARSTNFDLVPAGRRIPEWVVERGKQNRLFCRR